METIGKKEVAEVWSWFGLTKTNEFANWGVINNYEITVEDGIPTSQNLVFLKKSAKIYHAEQWYATAVSEYKPSLKNRDLSII